MKEMIWLHDYKLLIGTEKFVNIEIGTGKTSTETFVNPHSIMELEESDLMYEFKDEMVLIFDSFFKRLLDSIMRDDYVTQEKIRMHLHEAEYVCLGYGDATKGKAFDKVKFKNLCSSIRNSPAFKSGLIKDIADFSLYCEGVGDDLICDLLVNLIYPFLSELTKKVIVDSGQNSSNNHYTESLYSWDLETDMWSMNSNKYRAYMYSEKVFIFTPLSICNSKYSSRNKMRDEFQEYYHTQIIKEMSKSNSKKIYYKESLNYFRKTHMSSANKVNRSNPNKTEFLFMVSIYADRIRSEK